MKKKILMVLVIMFAFSCFNFLAMDERQWFMNEHQQQSFFQRLNERYEEIEKGSLEYPKPIEQLQEDIKKLKKLNEIIEYKKNILKKKIENLIKHLRSGKKKKTKKIRKKKVRKKKIKKKIIERDVEEEGEEEVFSSRDVSKKLTEEERLEWLISPEFRVKKFIDLIKDARILIKSKTFTLNKIKNHIYLLKSYPQEGAQCGPSALFNCSKISQFFNMNKTYKEAVGKIIDFGASKLNDQVEFLNKKKLNVEWCMDSELKEFVKKDLVPGLKRNVSVVPALPMYFRSIFNPQAVYSKAEENLLAMNLKNKKNGFSYSFIIPDFDTESFAYMGHWICVHVVKAGGQYYWFVVCSLNSDQLIGDNLDRIKFLIYKLLKFKTDKLKYHKKIIGKKEKAERVILKGIGKRIECAFKIRNKDKKLGQLRRLLADLDDIEIIKNKPEIKKQIEDFKTKILEDEETSFLLEVFLLQLEGLKEYEKQLDKFVFIKKLLKISTDLRLNYLSGLGVYSGRIRKVLLTILSKYAYSINNLGVEALYEVIDELNEIKETLKDRDSSQKIDSIILKINKRIEFLFKNK